MGVLPEDDGPGPGTYARDQSQAEFVTDIEKKLRSRTGAFLSSDDRFHNGPMDDKMEAPAEPPKEEKTRKKVTFPSQGSFLSHTERFVEQEKPVPPPGSYDLSMNWAPKNTTLASNKSFSSSSARFHPKEVFTGVMMKEVPAPGEYDRIKVDAPKTDSHKGFLSTENRWQENKAEKAPGPGQYRHQEGLIKRSFNVTIDI